MDQGKTFVILESTSRVGGRVHTIRIPTPSGTIVFDSGANWAHDQFVNDLYPILLDLGVNMTLFDQDDSSVWNNNGRQENTNQLTHMISFTEGVWTQSNMCRANNVSDANAIEGCTTYDFDKPKVETYLQFSREQWIGNNLEYHNSEAWDNSTEDLGPDHIINGGYDIIFNKIVTKSPSYIDNIHLNSKVVKIEYENTDGSALVTYRNILGSLQTVRATERVIVTPSINILKANVIDFVPDLPASHTNALNGLMCSAANKIALYFDSVGAAFLSNPDLAHNYMFRYGQENGGGVRQTDGLTCFINWMFVTGQPLVTSYYVGDFSRYLETLTDQQAVDMMMRGLRQFIGTKQNPFPDPIGYVVTRWGMNPDAMCSYTDVSVNGTVSDFATLAQSVGTHKNVYISGEASNFPKHGTVHGGWLSGQQSSNFTE